MSGSVNKVILVGNLGKDPESRAMNDGSRIVSFPLATGESWKDKKTGERKDVVEWHRISILNEALGDIAMKYLKKGSRVYVEGKINTRRWKDAKGEDQSITEVVIGRFKGELTLLERNETKSIPQPTGTYKQPFQDDDLPF